MKTLFKSAVVASLIATGPAFAANWVTLTTGTDGSVSFIDKDSVNLKAKNPVGWFKHVYPSGEEDVSLIAYNCTSPRPQYWVIEGHRYSTTGSPIGSYVSPKNNWMAVIPGTMGETTWKAICGLKYMQESGQIK